MLHDGRGRADTVAFPVTESQRPHSACSAAIFEDRRPLFPERTVSHLPGGMSTASVHARATSGAVVVRCAAGPDAGWSVMLEPGSHWLGRARGPIRVADPFVEPHHALLAVGVDGSVGILQTSGRSAVRVDGAPTTGWTGVRAGSTVEVGASRFVVGSSVTGCGAIRAATARVIAPHEASTSEHERFRRDVDLASAASRSQVATRPDRDSVDLGVAELDVPIDIRDANGRPITVGELDLAAQAIVGRSCRTTAPCWLTMAPDTTVAIVAPEPAVVADAIRVQLPPERRARIIVAEPGEAGSLAASRRPMLVLSTERAEAPPWCRSLLEVGTTWRGAWWERLHDHPERVVSLHVRGYAGSARASGSADAGRSVVAEEVSGARAEVGRSVVGVPESARRQ